MAERLRLDGELTMHTAASVFARPLPAGGDGWIIDFSDVSAADSAALALLLAWLRRAKARGIAVELHAFPAALHALARLYGIDVLLPGAA
ncbi:MAG: STAS domain-containing protein [Azoarcus sp.]|jgi:phospholipid transport system transporter-binding protein|nr:STAS domain-containing protein [Azoarcus sp.]